MSLITPSVTMRENRAIPLTPGDPLASYGTARSCTADGCTTRLSRYNPAPRCAVHRGWQEVPQTRQRR